MECGLCEMDCRGQPWIDCPEEKCPYKKKDTDTSYKDMIDYYSEKEDNQ